MRVAVAGVLGALRVTRWISVNPGRFWMAKTGSWRQELNGLFAPVHRPVLAGAALGDFTRRAIRRYRSPLRPATITLICGVRASSGDLLPMMRLNRS